MDEFCPIHCSNRHTSVKIPQTRQILQHLFDISVHNLRSIYTSNQIQYLVTEKQSTILDNTFIIIGILLITLLMSICAGCCFLCMDPRNRIHCGFAYYMFSRLCFRCSAIIRINLGCLCVCYYSLMQPYINLRRRRRNRRIGDRLSQLP